MIHVVTGENVNLYSREMEQVYRLRHKIFVEEMGWEALRRPDAREIDQFDDSAAVHMLYIEDGSVIGYQRMLPSVRPHLLTEVLRHLCDGDPPRGPEIWEWTRYCVSRSCRDRGRMLSPISCALQLGMVEWGIDHGVSQFIIETNPIFLLRLIQLNFRITPLGIPKQVGKDSVIAVTAAFDGRTLDRLREVRGDNQRVIIPRPERARISRA
uniref:Autoinducer synthesis protein n=1 Tax=Rhodopseudomonas palustris (strain DX-1) TaxID=652103 RepID=E6VQ15_RHOPX